MADHEMGDNEEHAMQEEAVPTAGAAAQRADYSMGGDTAEVRRNGRLVNLRRGRDGGYQILMRDRVIQGFCSEFEDITGWRMPVDSQIQARITIVPNGRLRGAVYPEELPDQSQRVEGFATERATIVRRRLNPDDDDGVELQSIAHPGNPPMFQPDPPLADWQLEALRHLNMERSQLTHTIDMIESVGRR